MTAVRRISAGILLALAVLGLSGCGFGPGEDRGEAHLLVTRDYGRQVIFDGGGLELNQSSTALRLLDQKTDIETAYGGGFVQAVNGVSGGGEAGRSLDWFFSVNGVMAGRGSAEFPVGDGDTVWWDYRDWTDAMQVGAVVGAYPAPFSTGYDGTRWPTEIDCMADPGTCSEIENRLRSDRADLNSADDGSRGDGDSAVPSIRVLVGPWAKLRELAEGRSLAAGPTRSGVFARFDGDDLIGLDPAANQAVNLGPDSGLVAALRQGQAPPVWLVTGGNKTGVERAAMILNRSDLDRRYAAVAVAGKVGSLPWQETEG